jgi:hypothetical protein
MSVAAAAERLVRQPTTDDFPPRDSTVFVSRADRRLASIARNMLAAGLPWHEVRRVLRMDQRRIEALLAAASPAAFAAAVRSAA